MNDIPPDDGPMRRLWSAYEALDGRQQYATLALGLAFIEASGRISGHHGSGVSLGPAHWDLLVGCADALSGTTGNAEMIGGLTRFVNAVRSRLGLPLEPDRGLRGLFDFVFGCQETPEGLMLKLNRLHDPFGCPVSLVEYTAEAVKFAVKSHALSSAVAKEATAELVSYIIAEAKTRPIAW